MGVNLGDLLTKEKCSLKDLSGKIIAIDAYNALYQFLSIIRQRDGTPLMDSQGRITSHLCGLLYRTANLVESGIMPVYVFDGAPHPLKAKTLAERKEIREEAEKEWKEALEKGDIETARKKAQQASRITDEILQQSKKLLDLLGIPWVQAPSEGEAQASHMARRGDVYAVASQDADSLLFGAPVLVRNLTISGRRKLPNKQVYIKIEPELVKLEETLKNLGVTREQLVDMAILIGTDFNEGIEGIGPKKSYDLIKRYGNIEKALEALGRRDAIDENTLKTVREIFLEPEVTDDYTLEWHSPDEKEVIAMLCDEHQFSKDRVMTALQKFQRMKNMFGQSRLF
ncbi:MAG: flap endonuclease-1 [Thermoplasmata archaeon]|nr:MAG: flap endonuclease-1 [Thermoplasmata archaeon]KAA0017322.1 MAG: flap endonuclease-1 [Thermoplasmata archaeon]